jgi:hypothetical protein
MEYIRRVGTAPLVAAAAAVVAAVVAALSTAGSGPGPRAVGMPADAPAIAAAADVPPLVVTAWASDAPRHETFQAANRAW